MIEYLQTLKKFTVFNGRGGKESILDLSPFLSGIILADELALASKKIRRLMKIFF